jgi:large subunit ribosomal protein L3
VTRKLSVSFVRFHCAFIGLLGNKIGMTQVWWVGNIIPVTILKVGPCVITQVKTQSKNGYDSIQIGYGNVSSKTLTQPELGHLQNQIFNL